VGALARPEGAGGAQGVRAWGSGGERGEGGEKGKRGRRERWGEGGASQRQRTGARMRVQGMTLPLALALAVYRDPPLGLPL